jgi:hypothetical protein
MFFFPVVSRKFSEAKELMRPLEMPSRFSAVHVFFWEAITYFFTDL